MSYGATAAKGRRAAIDPQTAERGARAWLRSLRGEVLVSQDRDWLEQCGGRERGREFRFDLPDEPPPGVERRASMSLQVGPAGGYLRSPGMIHSFEAALKFHSAIRRVASIVRTESGTPLRVATTSDVTEGEIIGENADRGEQAIVFGAVTLDSFTFSSKRCVVPNELLEDSAIAADAIGAILGERVGRRQSRHFTANVMAAATRGRLAASSTAITPDDLLALVGSVDPAYRENGGWQMHADILLQLRLAKDATGHPILTDGSGREPLLLGYPVTPNLNMDSAAASGAKTVAFGDWSKVLIRDVREVVVRHLAERYRDLDQDGFIATHRSDAALIDAGTHPIKYLEHP